MCERFRIFTPEAEAKWEDLRLRIAYALDAMNKTVYLNEENTERWKLTTQNGTSLIGPIDFTIYENKIYIIDKGTLYKGDLLALPDSGGSLMVEELFTPDMNRLYTVYHLCQAKSMSAQR